ncbi:hypothetical protein OCS_06336 [Ophiocordyceps sinensis CO18]|uniref:Uncharacterized protein n=3 Tax=Ophiocordyceps sinensis TaxID=72228 RepID=T5A812_OPHSC|nr:hypothetical protein OCS_06336 [Ophiocordyceps sinensis CO18]
MVSPVDAARLRHGLSPLTTSSLASHVANHLNTPISAVSMTSSHIHSAHMSGGPIQPYNPQEWVSPPPVSSPVPTSNWTRHIEHDPQGDDGSVCHVLLLLTETQASAPPPPPPYSPPRSRRQRPVSTAFEYAIDSAATSSLRNAPVTVSMQPLPSVEPQVAHGYPPPPDTTMRGCSRERRFGLPLLGRRRDHDQLSSSPEGLPPVPLPVLPLRKTLGNSAVPLDPERMASVPPIAVQAGPPAARRAASTGALDTPSSARSRAASRPGWGHAMPLPPPPPGPPPPSGLRSQSVQSADRNFIPVISPPTRRPPPSGVWSLGPVPPTPADWVDEDVEPCLPERGRSEDLTIDPQTAANYEDAAEPLASSPSAYGLLNRAGAVRHDKTIIQRRSESRHRNPVSPHGLVDAASRPSHISDIVLTRDADGSGPDTSSSMPRSSGGTAHTAPFRTSEPSSSSVRQQESQISTPRAPGSTRLPRLDTATPPFSPHPGAKANQPSNGSGSVAPRALPTPPPQTRSASSSRLRDGARPLSDKASVSQHLILAQSADQFATAAVERFRAFAEREAAASMDAERVRLFADFIVSESRIRRERYSTAIGAMGSEIFDLTRDLFRPMPMASAGPNASPREDLMCGSGFPADEMSNSAPASANLPVTPSDDWTPNNANRAANYMPSLSPILSMSVSENYEKGSSRGRPPSRWWESGSQGDQSRGIERSKRESKYMGVSKDQWVEEEQDSMTQGTRGGHCGRQLPSDYPPEKAGWHPREDQSWTPELLRTLSATTGSSTMSPAWSRKPESLDVSRLVTLPPPYPRHHPAVNNNHPELAAMRGSVRLLSDLVEMDKAKEGFTVASSKRREGFSQAASERQQSLRANLQEEIVAGNLGYADAAAIEADSQEQEKGKKKELEKTEYEHFQNEVVLPLNDLLTGRISRTTDLFDDLTWQLFDNGRTDADMPQEEGDDRPELLEKLTLLKWIFETRETLYRAIYDIISDRNRRYREVVVAPYKLSGNAEKLKSAEAFFAEDAAKRAHAYANEMLDRARKLQAVVEEAVERGVALQLSAFWDIAPPLRQLLDGIPDNLGVFGVQIPPSELAENPSYHDHPMQYLYSLLQHAEKSTHQFIESHTNLLCLLHQVKEAVVNAHGRVLATRVEAADGISLEAEERERQANAMRHSENRRLTDDLKDKVRVVQDQWNSALGEGIHNVKERIGAWLLQSGGWDETLEESTGFGAM